MAHLWRVLPITMGWYLAMSYPLQEGPAALLLSLAIGTLGVACVAISCYMFGYWDAMPPKDKRPFGRQASQSEQRAGGE